MKSNISKKDINSGKEIIEKLSNLNIKLLPDQLKEIIPDYKKFLPHPEKYGLWLSKKAKQAKFNQKYDKILLLLSGLTASGKDAIREEMQKLDPTLFSKSVTATSRPPREGEIHGQDYYFYESHQTLLQSIKNGEFIEYYKRGETYYGLPKESLKNSLNQSTPVIYSQLELSGWFKIEKYLKKTNQSNVLILKMFVLPEMTFVDYQNWLTEKRNDHDLESRIHKTGWELKKAPKKSDFIIINRFEKDTNSLTKTAQTIIDQISELLATK